MMAYHARHKREERNVIMTAFRDISIGADCYFSLKHSNLLHRFWSGGNSTHCYFLSPSTSLSSLQYFLYSLFFCFGLVHNTLGKDYFLYIFTLKLLFQMKSALLHIILMVLCKMAAAYCTINWCNLWTQRLSPFL